MRTVSQLYKTLRIQTGSFYEVEVLQGNRTYGIDRLVALRLAPTLFDGSGPQVGQAYSTKCDLTLMESYANWPRMAAFEVRLRLSSADGTQKSEWLHMGTYYTDERKKDKAGNLTIVAYDGMLLTEQYWTDKIDEEDLPSNWPITAREWATMVQGAGLVRFAGYNGVNNDNLTFLDDTVPIIGLNTSSTIRDNLKTIAAEHGGNWQLTSKVISQGNEQTTVSELRLVPFANMVDGEAAIAGIAIAGISVVGDSVIESLIESGAEYAFLGMLMQTFESSPALPGITGVHLETEAGQTATAGTDTYILNGRCEFSSSVGVGELCLGKVQGYVYKPFTATKAQLDPAAEVGDLVIIDGKSYQMMEISWNINTWPTADIGAAYESEVDHEYSVISPTAKAYRKSVSSATEIMDNKLKDYIPKDDTEAFASAIQQSAGEIELVVAHAFVSKTDLLDYSAQLDGNIQVWKQSTDPASSWNTQESRENHIGDIWHNTSTDANKIYTESDGVFLWLDISVSDAFINAIQGSSGQIYTEQPSPPYRKDTLWIDEDGTLWTCVTERDSGDFDADDWEEMLKYTDDSRATRALEKSDTVNARLSAKSDEWDSRDQTTQTIIGQQEERITRIGTHLDVQAGYVEIWHDHSRGRLKLQGDKIAMLSGEEELTYWTTSEMLAPKKIRIPTTAGATVGDGGSLQIGGLLFQPRSNGNMSIMWVDDETLVRS